MGIGAFARLHTTMVTVINTTLNPPFEKKYKNIELSSRNHDKSHIDISKEGFKKRFNLNILFKIQ